MAATVWRYYYYAIGIGSAVLLIPAWVAALIYSVRLRPTSTASAAGPTKLDWLAFAGVLSAPFVGLVASIVLVVGPWAVPATEMDAGAWLSPYGLGGIAIAGPLLLAVALFGTCVMLALSLRRLATTGALSHRSRAWARGVAWAWLALVAIPMLLAILLLVPSLRAPV